MAASFSLDTPNDKPVMRDDNGAECGLYSVVIFSPTFGVRTVYVLATDEEHATDQAKCVCKVAVYHTSQEVQELIRTTTTRLPFAVEGWGGVTF
jgi:hypothetical protein